MDAVIMEMVAASSHHFREFANKVRKLESTHPVNIRKLRKEWRRLKPNLYERH